MASQWWTGNVQGLLIALKACGKTKDLLRGKQLHAEAVDSRHFNLYVANALIDMHAKCGNMADAWEVFESLKHPTAVSWTALMFGYASNGQAHTALDLFNRMRIEGPAPDRVAIVAALKACISLALEGASRWAECKHKGKEIQNVALKNGCSSDTYVQNTLMDLYTKCGSMVDAYSVFKSMQSMQSATVVSWTVLILGYVENGEEQTAVELFIRMRVEGPAPNSVTLVASLRACTSLAVKEGASRWAEFTDRGKAIHNLAMENDCKPDVYMQSTLVNMYAKCGSMSSAGEAFDCMTHPSVVSWNVLILGYAENGQGQTALDLFSRMRTEGPAPVSVTFIGALKACTSLAVNEKASMEFRNTGKQIHNFSVENGCNSDACMQSALVDMYAKSSSMVDAREVFDGMENPTVGSWTALILGYVDNGQGNTALDLFTRMRSAGPVPDSVTFIAALRACGLVGALEFGRIIHSEIDENVLDVALINCLVDFYGKCGSLVEAQSVFYLHAKKRDVVTWNALLSGFSSCGDSKAVFRLFEEMQTTLKPNGVTFLCILKCCSHVGLVEKGKVCFDTMTTKYGMVPTVEHYNCMVDMFGRANKLDDAVALLEHMPCNPNCVTWMTILGACRKWNDVGIGRLASQFFINQEDVNMC